MQKTLCLHNQTWLIRPETLSVSSHFTLSLLPIILSLYIFPLSLCTLLSRINSRSIYVILQLPLLVSQAVVANMFILPIKFLVYLLVVGGAAFPFAGVVHARRADGTGDEVSGAGGHEVGHCRRDVHPLVCHQVICTAQ